MDAVLAFRKTLEKHGLNTEENAEKIAEFVTNHPKKTFKAEDFAKEFDIPLEDALIILKVIYKGIEFRKNLR
jgi:hypothetical protein